MNSCYIPHWFQISIISRKFEFLFHLLGFIASKVINEIREIGENYNTFPSRC